MTPASKVGPVMLSLACSMSLEDNKDVFYEIVMLYIFRIPVINSSL